MLYPSSLGSWEQRSAEPLTVINILYTNVISILYTMMPPKKEKTMTPVDAERRVPADPRDPRSNSKQWPCFNNHRPGKQQGNKWGRWTNCSTCALRMEYIPLMGAPGKQTHGDNPTNVQKALAELQLALGEDRWPTEEMVHAMIAKVTAEIRMSKLLEECETTWKTNQSKVTKALQQLSSPTTSLGHGARSSADAGYAEPKASPSRSTGSWEALETPSLDSDIMTFLTMEEREQIQSRVRERRQQLSSQTQQVPSDVELEPDYSQSPP